MRCPEKFVPETERLISQCGKIRGVLAIGNVISASGEQFWCDRSAVLSVRLQKARFSSELHKKASKLVAEPRLRW